MDLECVASFLILAEEEHFGRAAARLHLSSPALTKRIQRLEQQVGITLIEHRNSGGFTLTAAGRRFLPQAKILLLQARVARSAALEPSGSTIRLGVPGRVGESPGRDELRLLANLLHQNRPETRLACIAVPYPLMAESLLRRWIDVAWTTSGFEHTALESTPLTMMWRVGVVPVQHGFAGASALDVADFAGLPMLHNPEIPAGMMSLGCLGDYRPLSEAKLVPIQARRIGDVLQGVSRGLGVAVVPAALLPSIVSAGLRPIPLVGLKPFEIHASRRREDTRDAVMDLICALGSIATLASRTYTGPKIR
ncbi:LysR family transcriptional regulator [Kocuria kalidii]|uniref:LysR family transcriptional regulator n=1 Tax=Kocuria kalidii TaxID=3376283 RepID=UPI0037A68173